MFTRARLTRWTEALINNPDQQMIGQLCNIDGTKFCCLGKLSAIEGIPRIGTTFHFPDAGGEIQEDATLGGKLSLEFGHCIGSFEYLQMPYLRYEFNDHEHEMCWAAGANDALVPWAIIAKHFNEWYPCSDEPKKENIPGYVFYPKEG